MGLAVDGRIYILYFVPTRFLSEVRAKLRELAFWPVGAGTWEQLMVNKHSYLSKLFIKQLRFHTQPKWKDKFEDKNSAFWHHVMTSLT